MKQSRSPFAISARSVVGAGRGLERDLEVDADLDEREASVLLASRDDAVGLRRSTTGSWPARRAW